MMGLSHPTDVRLRMSRYRGVVANETKENR